MRKDSQLEGVPMLSANLRRKRPLSQKEKK
jgi:hypothetical protein